VVLFGLPVLIWTIRWRQWELLRDHRWATGILLFLVLVAPWFVLCELRNPGFLKYFFLNENLLRFVKHNYGDAYGSGHMYKRGSALLMFLGASAPWCLLALWQVVRSRSAKRVLTLADKTASFLFLGFAVGTLFWCLARQLLITYTLPLVPLFAAWLAIMVREEPELRRKIVAASSALLLAMSGISVICPLFLQATATTRPIVRLAQQQVSKQASEPLLFAFRTPYSALFYARNQVQPHPEEPLRESLARCRSNHTESALVVLGKKQKRELQGLKPESWTKLASAGNWTLARVQLQTFENAPPLKP